MDSSIIFPADAASSSHITLVAIGNLPLPTPTRLAVGHKVLEESVPAFREDEARELLASPGAPDIFLTAAWVGTISVICRQHPLLLAEAARFLEAKGWNGACQGL